MFAAFPYLVLCLPHLEQVRSRCSYEAGDWACGSFDRPFALKLRNSQDSGYLDTV